MPQSVAEAFETDLSTVRQSPDSFAADLVAARQPLPTSGVRPPIRQAELAPVIGSEGLPPIPAAPKKDVAEPLASRPSPMSAEDQAGWLNWGHDLALSLWPPPPRSTARIGPEPTAHIGPALPGTGMKAQSFVGLDAPAAQQIAKGVKDLTTAILAHPRVQSGEPHVLAEDDRGTEAMFNGAADIVEGVFAASQPLALAGIVLNPISSVAGLVVSGVAQHGVQKALEQAGASPSLQRLGGDLAAAAVAGYTAKTVSEGLTKGGEAARAARIPGEPPPEPVEPTIVGRGTTEGAMVGKPRLEPENVSVAPSASTPVHGGPDPVAEELGLVPAPKVTQMAGAPAEFHAVEPDPVASELGLTPVSTAEGQRALRGTENPRTPGERVQPAVISRGQELKVFKPVVEAIPVDVVNMLGGEQRTAHVLLHDPAVFVNALARDKALDVPATISALRTVIAARGAELRSQGSPAGRPEDIVAIQTLDRHLGEALGSPRTATGSPLSQEDAVGAATGTKPTRPLTGISEEGLAAPGAEERNLHRQSLTRTREDITGTGVESGAADVQDQGQPLSRGVGTVPAGRPDASGGAPAGPSPADLKIRQRALKAERRAKHQAIRDEYAAAVAAAPKDVFDRLIAQAHAAGYEGEDAPLHAELANRLAFLEEGEQEFKASGHDPQAILKAVAKYGGLSVEAESAQKRELLDLAQAGTASSSGKHPPFGMVGGVQGVINLKKGLSLDGMLEAFGQDPEFSHITSLEDLKTAIEDAATAKAPVGLPVDRLEKHINPDWWKRLSPPPDEQDFDADLADTRAENEGDTSFEPAALEAQPVDVPTTFWKGDKAEYTGKTQQLHGETFYELRLLEGHRKGETVVTQHAPETQPRLPEAGQVRDQEVQTPQIGDSPFSLSREAEQRSSVEPSMLDRLIEEESGELTLEPAARKVAAIGRHERDLVLGVFAPAKVGVAPIPAGIIRAHNAAHDQRTVRVKRMFDSWAKAADGWSEDQQHHFIDVMQGLEPVASLPQEWRNVAMTLRAVVKDWTDLLLKYDLLDNYLEHYWPQEWQKDSLEVSALKKLFGRRPMQGREAFRKHRTIPSNREGRALGFVEVEPNPFRQLQRKIFEMSQSVMGREMHEDFITNGFHALVPATAQRPEEIRDWKRVPEYALGTKYGPRQEYGRLVIGHYYAPPEVVRLIENRLSPGLWGRSVIFDAYNTAGNLSTQFLLGWSSFHAWLTGLESVISKQSVALEAAARGEWDLARKFQGQVGPHGLVRDLMRGYRGIKEFYSRDADANDVTGLIGQLVQGGIGFGWSGIEHADAPAKFMQDVRALIGAVKRGDVKTAAKKVATGTAHGALAFWELPTSVIMNHWVPYLKMSAILDMTELEMRRLGPGATLADLRRVMGEISDTVDDRFGQLRHDNLFWDNTHKQLAMAGFLSVTWNVGSLRALGGALGQIPRTVGKVKAAMGGGGVPPDLPDIPMTRKGSGPDREPRFERASEPWLQRNVAWLFSLAMIVGLADAIYQKIRSGKNPGEKADGSYDLPLAMKDFAFPRNGEIDSQGREERDSAISYLKDYFSWVHHPVATVTHKFKPLLTMLWEAVENENFFGNEIRNEDDPVVRQLWDTVKASLESRLPISVQSARHRLGEGASILEQMKAWAKIQAVPFTPASVQIERSDAENYLHSLMPPVHRTKEEAEKADARFALREGIRSGTKAEALQAAREAGLSAASRRSILRSERQGALKSAFERATWTQAAKAYELATPEERASLKAMLSGKFGRARASAGNAEARQTMTDKRNALMALPTGR